ncbi:MAG: hypothetical protein U0640_03850 [Phycisphaerales bacterium]
MTRFTLAAGVLVSLATSCHSAFAAEGEGRYFVVELAGEFGKDIHAPGIKATIADAKKANATHIVFKLDSAGGFVKDAEAIHNVLSEDIGNMKVITIVSQAFSASVWVLCNSDYIFFDGKDAAGAAVIFNKGEDGAPTAVEAKFASGWWATIATAAERHNQSADVYRAMMIQEAELFSWTIAGELKVDGRRPEDVNAINIRELDTKETVLSLTPRLAESIGFGQKLPTGGLPDIGKILQLTKWEEVKSSNSDPMRRTTSVLKPIDKQVEECRTRIKKNIEQVYLKIDAAKARREMAERASPEATVTVYYREGSGYLTAGSQQAWRQQTERAISAWRDYQDTLKAIDTAQGNYTESIAALERSWARQHEKRLWQGEPKKWTGSRICEIDINKDTEWKIAEQQIAQLRARMNRNTIDR